MTIFGLLLIWFVLATVILLLRLRVSEVSRPLRLGMAAGQTLAMTVFFGNWFLLSSTNSMLYAVLFWGALVISNLILSTVGVLEGYRPLALLGAGLTAVAIILLVIVHSMSSIVVIWLGSVLCLLSVTWKRRRTAAAV